MAAHLVQVRYDNCAHCGSLRMDEGGQPGLRRAGRLHKWLPARLISLHGGRRSSSSSSLSVQSKRFVSNLKHLSGLRMATGMARRSWTSTLVAVDLAAVAWNKLISVPRCNHVACSNNANHNHNKCPFLLRPSGLMFPRAKHRRTSNRAHISTCRLPST